VVKTKGGQYTLKKGGQYRLKKRGKYSVCKDNVYEDDDAIIRSVRICQWSGCNDGNTTGDLVTCPKTTKAKKKQKKATVGTAVSAISDIFKKAKKSAAVSAAQISGIFWAPALIALMALTGNA